MAYRSKITARLLIYSSKRYCSTSKSSQATTEESSKREISETNENVEKISAQKTRESRWHLPEGHQTPISIYNPITKTIVPFYTKHPGVVKWYMCGPTVYDSSHIGHASCYIRMDIIRRILEDYFKINCVIAMGITNIDDKIIKAAQEKKVDFKKLAQKYEEEFFYSMNLLDVKPPTIYTRVTDYIPNIQLFIQTLLDKEMAFINNDGDVVFATKKYEHYGKLVPISPDVENSEFALWKRAKKGEPSFETPWDGPNTANKKTKGRPGWHIECSVMASHVFGRDLDIHSGGIDLKFPHHENEEAQSCAYHDVKQWVNYWIHAGHLKLTNTKMSKSLKNTISINELLQKFTAKEFRFFCLMTKYQREIEYSPQALMTSNSVYEYFRTFVSTCDSYVQGSMNLAQIDEPALYSQIEQSKQQIYEALCYDFDTPKVIRILQDLAVCTNSMLNNKLEEQFIAARSIGSIAAASQCVQSTLDMLGVSLTHKIETQVEDYDYRPDLSRILDSTINFRSQVRLSALGKLTNKSTQPTILLLELCDSFRDQLQNLGILIKDHQMKSSWHVFNPKTKTEDNSM